MNTIFKVLDGSDVVALCSTLWSALDHADAVKAHGGYPRILRVEGNTVTECAGDKINAQSHKCNRYCH